MTEHTRNLNTQEGIENWQETVRENFKRMTEESALHSASAAVIARRDLNTGLKSKRQGYVVVLSPFIETPMFLEALKHELIPRTESPGYMIGACCWMLLKPSAEEAEIDRFRKHEGDPALFPGAERVLLVTFAHETFKNRLWVARVLSDDPIKLSDFTELPDLRLVGSALFDAVKKLD